MPNEFDDGIILEESPQVEDPALVKESQFLVNLAEKIPKEKLATIGRLVVDDYKTDLGSRSGWDASVKDYYTLFTGMTKKKSRPWEGSSNVNVPLMSVSCLQFQARSFDKFFPGKEIVKCYSTDGATEEVAERCQRFMNWQLTEQMEGWEEDMDKLLLLLPIFGVAVKKTYYDASLKRNVSMTLGVDEFVAPYGVKNLDDASRKTHVYTKVLNDIKIMGRDGIWANTETIQNVPGSVSDTEVASEYKEASKEVTGISDSLESKDQPRTILEQHRTLNLRDKEGEIEEQYIVTVDKETSTVLRIEELKYIDPIAKREKNFNYFTAYNFIPNPDSWMGFGFGHLMAHLNHSTNTLINQMIDSGTLSNTISGFFDKRQLRDESGDLIFDMGMLKGVNLSAEDIKKAMYIHDFKPPSQALFALLGHLQDYARDISSVSESMLGKVPPSDTTATTMLAVMEQGLKVFSTIHKRIHRVFKKELRKIATLNAQNVDEDLYRMVQDSTSDEYASLESGKLDFQNAIDVIPVSDPTITSRAENLIRATRAYELGSVNPLIAENPQALYRLTYNLFEALEVNNIDEVLQLPPPPPEPPDLRPEEEEAEFLRESGVDPLPEQDHAAHLFSHELFEESEFGVERLTPQGKKLLSAHILETVSMLYLSLSDAGPTQEEIVNDVLNGGLQGVDEQPVHQAVPGQFEEGAGVPITQPGI